MHLNLITALFERFIFSKTDISDSVSSSLRSAEMELIIRCLEENLSSSDTDVSHSILSHCINFERTLTVVVSHSGKVNEALIMSLGPSI